MKKIKIYNKNKKFLYSLEIEEKDLSVFLENHARNSIVVQENQYKKPPRKYFKAK